MFELNDFSQKLTFTKTCTVEDEEGLQYLEGKTYEFDNEASVNHWLSRKVAVCADGKTKTAKPTTAKERAAAAEKAEKKAKK